jgi:hypothetical protein
MMTSIAFALLVLSLLSPPAAAAGQSPASSNGAVFVARIVPSEAQRKANSERSARLRDLVRREVWTELR